MRAIAFYFLGCLVLLVPRFALGEETYIGLDGVQHQVSASLSSRDFEVLIGAFRQTMYQNSGEVGTRDSLSVQGGDKVISEYLNDTLRKMAYLERLSYSRAIEKGIESEEWKEAKALIRKEVNEVTRGLGTSTNRDSLAATVSHFNQENAERQKEIDRYRGLLGQTLPPAGAETPRLDADQRKRYELTLKLLQDEEAKARFRQAPQRDLLKLFDEVPFLVSQCNERLFEMLPAALSGHYPPELSPALMNHLKERLEKDPRYARRFQEGMLAGSEKRKVLQIGSAQGLELFLHAGASHPSQKVSVAEGVKVNAGPFAVSAAPLFQQVARDYGKDVGPKQGLKMVGTPDTTFSGADTPELARAVSHATRLERNRMVPARFQYSACDYQPLAH